MKRGAGTHLRTSGGRCLKVPWCLPPSPGCALPETPCGEENVSDPAPQQRATTPGEPRRTAADQTRFWKTSTTPPTHQVSRDGCGRGFPRTRWCQLPRSAPLSPLQTAQNGVPQLMLVKKLCGGAHGAQQLPISKHSISPFGCCSPTFGALLDCPGAPRLSTHYLTKAPKKL